ncbi:hypothetical protein RFI_26482, partial [Reticulomyxa filosa]
CIDLNLFKFIKHDILLIKDKIYFHCFVSKSQYLMKINERYIKNNEILLFYKDTGILIEYNEEYNNFKLYKINICDLIRTCNCLSYVCMDDTILLLCTSNNNNM